MVEIVPYQDRWSTEFQEIASRLRGVLGPLALRIDHIGSTSIPGLAAKDIIDIQITVKALVPDVQKALEGLGYSRHQGIILDHNPPLVNAPAIEWEKWFFDEPEGWRQTNTHVRVAGRANQRYPLLFRDYLRAHPAVAAAYAQLKERLADNLADQSTYPEVKDPAVDLIYFAAEDWAKNFGWDAGDSDA